MEGDKKSEYFVSMTSDPVYDRLRRKKLRNIGTNELDMYMKAKHDGILASNLEAGTYRKIMSLAIVDAFSVELNNDEQADVLRAANGVRDVVKNGEEALKPK